MNHLSDYGQDQKELKDEIKDKIIEIIRQELVDKPSLYQNLRDIEILRLLDQLKEL
jgi:hypothetical protein